MQTASKCSAGLTFYNKNNTSKMSQKDRGTVKTVDQEADKETRLAMLRQQL